VGVKLHEFLAFPSPDGCSRSAIKKRLARLRALGEFQIGRKESRMKYILAIVTGLECQQLVSYRIGLCGEL
jgi:hypothetical protein